MVRVGRGLACVAPALVLAALVAPPGASATWAAPLDLSIPGQDAVDPQVAVDAGGDAVFTWRALDGPSYRVQARARSAAGALSAVQTLSPAGAVVAIGSAQVAVDADGDAVFAWALWDGANYRIQTRARSAAGVLSSVQTLSVAGWNALVPRVAVDADGDAVFTWVRYDGLNDRVQARARSAAGVLSPVQTLSRAGQSAHDPHVTVDAAGNAVFSWELARVHARARSAAGSLSATQTLSSSNIGYSQLGGNANGDVVSAWVDFDNGPADQVARARTRSATGVLSSVLKLSPPGKMLHDTRVAVDADGDAVFAWVRYDGFNDRLQARARSAAGVLSAGQLLSTAGSDARAPEVAVDADGDAVFTWGQPIGAAVRIRARTRSAAGALGAGQTLSRAGQSASNPHVAVDADGDAIVVWQRGAFPNTRIQASAGP
jgi:hypothetical protein